MERKGRRGGWRCTATSHQVFWTLGTSLGLQGRTGVGLIRSEDLGFWLGTGRRSESVPGSLVGRPLSLSRQEMTVTWSREGFLDLSTVDTLRCMWATMMRAPLHTAGCFPQHWSLHAPGSSSGPTTSCQVSSGEKNCPLLRTLDQEDDEQARGKGRREVNEMW